MFVDPVTNQYRIGRPFSGAQQTEFEQILKDRDKLATIIKGLELRAEAYWREQR